MINRYSQLMQDVLDLACRKCHGTGFLTSVVQTTVVGVIDRDVRKHLCDVCNGDGIKPDDPPPLAALR